MSEIHWSIYISWLVTGLGWFIALKINAHKLRTTENFQILSTAEDIIYEIEKDALRFWMLNGDDISRPQLLADINLNFQKLSRKMHALQNRNTNYWSSKEFLEFKKEVTGGQAESLLRQACNHQDQKLKDINIKATKLVRALNTSHQRVCSKLI